MTTVATPATSVRDRPMTARPFPARAGPQTRATMAVLAVDPGPRDRSMSGPFDRIHVRQARNARRGMSAAEGTFMVGPRVELRYDAAMTLVMTAITRQTVVQLADMRLTNIRTGQIVDEASAKIVAYLGRITFAFTGPACIDRTPTPEWISAVLDGVADPEDAPTALARAADRALLRYEPALKRYAIVGGGWLGPAAGRLRPV